LNPVSPQIRQRDNHGREQSQNRRPPCSQRAHVHGRTTRQFRLS
jgi:hypothetical protein